MWTILALQKWGDKAQSRGCKTRKGVVEDRHHQPVCDGEVIDPFIWLQHGKFQ